MPSLFDSETDLPEERKVLKRTLSAKNHVYFDRTLRSDLSLAECRV